MIIKVIKALVTKIQYTRIQYSVIQQSQQWWQVKWHKKPNNKCKKGATPWSQYLLSMCYVYSLLDVLLIIHVHCSNHSSFHEFQSFNARSTRWWKVHASLKSTTPCMDKTKDVQTKMSIKLNSIKSTHRKRRCYRAGFQTLFHSSFDKKAINIERNKNTGTDNTHKMQKQTISEMSNQIELVTVRNYYSHFWNHLALLKEKVVGGFFLKQ